MNKTPCGVRDLLEFCPLLFENRELNLDGGCPAVNRKTKTVEEVPTFESKGQELPLYGTRGAFFCLGNFKAKNLLLHLRKFNRSRFGRSDCLTDQFTEFTILHDFERSCRRASGRGDRLSQFLSRFFTLRQ